MLVNRPLIAATALVAGLVAVPVPTAYAAPPTGCTFPAVVNINISDGSTMSFAANGTAVNGPTTIGPPALEGTPGALQGGIAPNGHVELTFIHGANDQRSFVGDVGDDARATGSIAGTPLTWATGGPLNCTKAVEAPKEGPTVSFDPILGGLVAHITDRSGVTSQCTYDADGFTRTFRLEANKSTDLEIVPAVPKLANWNINVTCDNGTSTQTTQFF